MNPITVSQYEELCEKVAKALAEECYGAGYYDAQHETQKRAFRLQADAAIRVVRSELSRLRTA